MQVAERIVDKVNSEWWKRDSKEAFVAAANKMLEKGLTEDETREILELTHVAMMAEYGSKARTKAIVTRTVHKGDKVSRKTLRRMDQSMVNLAKGIAGPPVDLKALRKYADDKES